MKDNRIYEFYFFILILFNITEALLYLADKTRSITDMIFATLAFNLVLIILVAIVELTTEGDKK